MLRFVNKNITSTKFYFSSNSTPSNVQFMANDSFMKIVLNRPKALNSLNLEMIRDLYSALPSVNKNKAFWIQGAGGKAFCAGGDVKALYTKDANHETRKTFFREEFILDYSLSQSSAIQIANWDGIVMGGGYGLTAFAPFRIATQNTMFAMPEGKLGFFTDVGSSHVLSRLRNNLGFYIGLTGSRIIGKDMYHTGLANYYIESKNVPLAYQQIKSALPSSSDAKATITNILNKYQALAKVQSIPDESTISSIFAEKDFKSVYRKASSSPTIQKALEAQCPISVAIIHKLIESAKNKSIKECFIQDFYLCQKAINDQNFSQGVRTVLIEKGAVPNWTHKHVLQVPEADVAKYFTFGSDLETLKI